MARLTGQEIAQNKLAQAISEKGIPTNQPTVGRYLHYLSDALLIREFRRYPLAKKASARVPAKTTVTDLGVRNAILYRGFADPRDRRSRVHEVDFVAERIDGEVLPVEVRFRKRIDAEDLAGLRHFRSCFDSKLSVLVTRDAWKPDSAGGQLSIPLVPFLLAF